MGFFGGCHMNITLNTIHQLNRSEYLNLHKNKSKREINHIKTQRLFEFMVCDDECNFGEDYRYTNTSTKVSLICKNGHVWDSSTPRNIMNGIGCPVCSGNSAFVAQTKLENMLLAEGHRLADDYVYTNYSTKVSLICKNGHVWNTSSPTGIKGGAMCPTCKINDGKMRNSRKIPDYVYILRSIDHSCDIIKIGITSTPERRLTTLKRNTPFNFEIFGLYKLGGSMARDAETAVKRLSKSLGTKFYFDNKFDGFDEWHIFNESLIAFVVDTYNKKSPT